jgi:methionyl aminopeptidase
VYNFCLKQTIFLMIFFSFLKKIILFRFSSPPTIRIDTQYPKKDFPENEIHPYKLDKSNRISAEEYKEKDKLLEHQIECLRKSAEVHRQVRKYAQTIIKPGERLIDICEKIEEMNRLIHF